MDQTDDRLARPSRFRFWCRYHRRDRFGETTVRAVSARQGFLRVSSYFFSVQPPCLCGEWLMIVHHRDTETQSSAHRLILVVYYFESDHEWLRTSFCKPTHVLICRK